MSSEPNPGAVLVVEDPFIRRLLERMLVNAGYQAVPADAQRGIELLRSGEPKVSLLITNTPEAFLEFAERIPVLYLATSPDADLAARFRACGVLRKPFLPAQLLAAVKELAGPL